LKNPIGLSMLESQLEEIKDMEKNQDLLDELEI
jgi:hypothetical protein